MQIKKRCLLSLSVSPQTERQIECAEEREREKRKVKTKEKGEEKSLKRKKVGDGTVVIIRPVYGSIYLSLSSLLFLVLSSRFGSIECLSVQLKSFSKFLLSLPFFLAKKTFSKYCG